MRSTFLALVAALAVILPHAVSAGDEAVDGKCLIFNLPAMKDGEARKLLELVPLLTLGGSLTNAGSASHPVMCFEYDDSDQARDVRSQLADVYGAKDVAAAAQFAKTCDDYGD